MFWGLIMQPGMKYAQTVEKSFHISMACLEANAVDNSLVSVILHIGQDEYVLCNLQKHKTMQAPLDLNFQAGAVIAFTTTGTNKVHLTGYLLDTDEDEDSLDLTDITNKLDDSLASRTKGKDASLKDDNQDDDDDEDEDDDDDEDTGNEDLAGMFAGELEEDSEGEDDSMDESEDDSEEEEVITPTAPKKLKVATPNSKKKSRSTEEIGNKSPKKTPSESQPGGKSPKCSGKQAKQDVKIQKTPKQGEQSPKTPAKPGSEKKGDQKTVVKVNGTGTPGQKSDKKNQKGESPGNEVAMKRVLEGGVVIEETKVGIGPPAKPGRHVSVYYVGRMKTNNKQFDSTTQGPGFKFRLGANEVIRGWDVGVAGMRVGGKRKIICPSAMAYGNKGSPPVIPPNSTLVFDVELRAIH